MVIVNQMDKELIAKIKLIQIRAKSLVNDVFAGQYESTFKGRGMEFEEVREYAPGDDIRHIDWNVTARMDRPFVKLHRDERELTVMFLVDVSGSTEFGTQAKFKNEIAAEITALLAYSALRNNDKIGLIIFSDHVEHYLPPKKGTGHVWRVIRDILSHRSRLGKTDVAVSLDYFGRVVKKKSIVFLISDFQGVDFPRQIRSVAKRHDLIAISITDPREWEMPPVGFVSLEDAETGEVLTIKMSANKAIEFRNRRLKERAEQRLFFGANGIDHISIQTDTPYIDPIVKFFRQREK